MWNMTWNCICWFDSDHSVVKSFEACGMRSSLVRMCGRACVKAQSAVVVRIVIRVKDDAADDGASPVCTIRVIIVLCRAHGLYTR